MTDENVRKLIELYRRTGSQKAFDVLMINFRDALYKIVHRMNSIEMSFDERYSTALEFLVRAIQHEFDLKQKKMKFLTFLFHRVPLRIIDAQRKELWRYKNKHTKKTITIKPTVYIEEPELFDIAMEDKSTSFIEEMENKELIVMLEEEIAKLPNRERVIMGCIYYGMSQNEIAEQLGVSGSRIAQLKKDASEILYNNLKERLNGEMDGIKTALA